MVTRAAKEKLRAQERKRVCLENLVRPGGSGKVGLARDI